MKTPLGTWIVNLINPRSEVWQLVTLYLTFNFLKTISIWCWIQLHSSWQSGLLTNFNSDTLCHELWILKQAFNNIALSSPEGHPLLGHWRADYGALLRPQILPRGERWKEIRRLIWLLKQVQVDVLQSEKDGDLKQKKKILEQVSQALDETEKLFFKTIFQAAEEDFGNTEWGRWRSWLWNTIE